MHLVAGQIIHVSNGGAAAASGSRTETGRPTRWSCPSGSDGIGSGTDGGGVDELLDTGVTVGSAEGDTPGAGVLLGLGASSAGADGVSDGEGLDDTVGDADAVDETSAHA